VTTFVVVGYIEHMGSLKYLTAFRKQEIQNNRYPIFPAFKCIRNLPFNFKGGMFFYFAPKKNFGQHKSYNIYFFCRTKRDIFFQNLTLGYVTKTRNQIILFSSTKIRIFFLATLGIWIFFLEKNLTPLPVKWSFPNTYTFQC
jgi:hypothetical protein